MLISKFNTINIDNIISEFETKYLFTFPEQYRLFLKKYNGGRTPKSKFKINKISSDIKGFYGLGDADENFNYHFFEKTHGFKGFLEEKVIPIAGNSFGDYIVIGIDENGLGKIFFFYHDRPKCFIELAECFSVFVQKCKSEKIGHIRTIEERKQGMIEKGYGDRITSESIKGWQAEIDLYSNIHQEELVL